MSSCRSSGGGQNACVSCLRRSWLLSELSGPLDCRARDRAGLVETLALADDELVRAFAGRRTSELRARFGRFDGAEIASQPNVQTICRHCRDYPAALAGPAAAHMLNVAGARGRLAELTAAPVVAIVGSRKASDYGMEMARSLARGLAASGVTVAASLADGIAVAAHAGALDGDGASIVVLADGLAVCRSARRRSLYSRLVRAGCAISELPAACAGRRWGQLAAERTVVELAALTVLVEATDTREELSGAHMAQALGRMVAAIPGRVTSPLSGGTHALLMSGAQLVRSPGDALELLYDGSRRRSHTPAAAGAVVVVQAQASLEPRLASMLDLVGAGCDTPDKLARAGVATDEVLLALSELELMGLLARGDGGRYLPRDATPSALAG